MPLRSYRTIGTFGAMLFASLIQGCFLDSSEPKSDGASPSALSVAPAATISGTAAIGAPIVNGSVVIKCAGGQPGSTSTGADGKFTVALAGISFPCALQVSGGQVNGTANTYTLHSFALASGNANITTLTQLATAKIVQRDPATYFQNLGVSGGTTYSVVSSPAITAAIGGVQTALGALTPAVDISAIGNFFTGAFDAKAGDPVDAKLDALVAALAGSGMTLATLTEKMAVVGTVKPPAGNWTLTITGTVSGAEIPDVPQSVALGDVPTTQQAFESVAQASSGTLANGLTITVSDLTVGFTPNVNDAVGDTIVGTFKATYTLSSGGIPAGTIPVDFVYTYQRVS
jgi:hypothetical protein